MSNEQDFDPGRYLTKVSGSDYLEVKFRLLWLRHMHPDAAIDTELTHFDDHIAVVKATVTLPSGGSATGWAQETPGDFRDYLEKCETKALGRALAALGFGTQFCPDFEFGADHGRVVDAPVRPQEPRRDAQPRQQASRQGGRVEQEATPRQVQFIAAIARELGMSEEELRAESSQSFSRDVSALNRRDASIFIERLQTRRNERMSGRPASGPPDPYEPADDTDSHNDSDVPAMIEAFNRNDLAAKHRQ